MGGNSSPSFDHHHHWIEDIISTPSKQTQPHHPVLLTSDSSPSEHVLRGSKSFTARSFRSRTSAQSLRGLPVQKPNNENLSVPGTDAARFLHTLNPSGADRVLGEIAPNYQSVRAGPPKFGPSPTPSLKKKKAEAIVKAHGSPTHVRVTAGGRVVPSVQSPLCYPRYGYSAIKVNGGLIKFAPNHQAGKQHWTQATENGFVAQDMQGNLCQIVNGTVMPLTEVDGALQLHIPAPNLNVTKRTSAQSQPQEQRLPQQRLMSEGSQIIAAEPSMSSQMSALELEYSKLEHELKDVDKTEVIHGRTMSKVAKEALVSKRRELIMNMDKIRKAIKGLKSQPSPLSHPIARPKMPNQSPSPVRNAGIPYNGTRHRDAIGEPVYGPFWAGTQQQQYAAQYPAQPGPSLEELVRPQPWPLMQGSMFVPLPSFDGTNGSLVPPFARNLYQGGHTGAAEQDVPAAMYSDTDTNMPTEPTHMPVETQVRSTTRSHALPIKAPERRPKINVKSCLNPMSPVYKPTVDASQSPDPRNETGLGPITHRAPTPISPSLQVTPPSQVRLQSKRASVETISLTKQLEEQNSSSISSFDTADFFPRDTREFSTRQHAYPFKADPAEDKENVVPDEHEDGISDDSPITHGEEQHNSNWNPRIPDNAFKNLTKTIKRGDLPTAPPGTPVDCEEAPGPDTAAMELKGMQWELRTPPLDLSAMPNRSTHNVSPKNKRGLLSTNKDTPLPALPSSSPARAEFYDEGREKPSKISALIDFTHKPLEWIEGYQAGLQRRRVGGDRDGEFLDGYCSGLLKSRPLPSSDPSPAPQQNGSPVQSWSRGTDSKLAGRSTNDTNPHGRPEHGLHIPLGKQTSALDSLKQAILDPQNENAILTPTLNSPHVSELPTDLGAWAKKQKSSISSNELSDTRKQPVTMPKRIDSGFGRQENASGRTSLAKPMNSPPDYTEHSATHPASPALSGKTVNSARSVAIGATPSINHRISSLTSIDSALYRSWPGHRVVSPHLDWKSASSVTHTAGLASGYFANVQFDGTQEHSSNPYVYPQTQLLTSAPHHTGAQSSASRTGVINLANDGNNPPLSPAQRSRFTEGSIDGLSSPPMSPMLDPVSPRPISPNVRTPIKTGNKKKDGSPCKSPSPAKAKFEHIAEKVGIKAAASNKAQEADSSDYQEHNSPQGKRRWRDVWRKQTGKDDVS